MPVVSVLAAPGDVDLPGIPYENLGPFGAWLNTITPVHAWVWALSVQASGLRVTVCGQDEQIPEGCRRLDVPLTDSEYTRFIETTEEPGR